MTPTIPEALATIRATGAGDDMTLGEIEARFLVSEPLLIEARQLLADMDTKDGETENFAEHWLSGDYDDHIQMKIALAGIVYGRANVLVPKPTDATTLDKVVSLMPTLEPEWQRAYAAAFDDLRVEPVTGPPWPYGFTAATERRFVAPNTWTPHKAGDPMPCDRTRRIDVEDDFKTWLNVAPYTVNWDKHTSVTHWRYSS